MEVYIKGMVYTRDGLSQGGGLHQGGLHQWPRGRSASPPNYAAIACILITAHYKRESEKAPPKIMVPYKNKNARHIIPSFYR